MCQATTLRFNDLFQTISLIVITRIDGTLATNFAAQGILEVMSGMLFGWPGGSELPLSGHASYDTAILKVLDEAGLNDLPVLANLDFGHTDPMFTLPLGVRAEIDCDRAELMLLEKCCVGAG